MNSFIIESATLDTLPDLYALYPEAGAARFLEVFRGRVARGEATLSDTLILRTPRGVEGTVTFGPAPHPYVFPHLRRDAPGGAVTAFLRDLRLRLAPERQLVLDTDRADVPARFALNADWRLDEEHLVYRTDLAARAFPRDPDVRPTEPGSADVQALLAALDRADLTLGDGWSLHGLWRDSQLLALGALGAGGPPGRPPALQIDLIGVQPASRRHGLGGRLHAHLLALGAAHHAVHVGGTSAVNLGMRRIFERHGARLTVTQRYFTPADIGFQGY